MSASDAPPRLPTAVISRKGVDRVRAGHPWIYRSDVTEFHADRGDVVEVRDGRGALLGRALSSNESQITLRMLTRDATIVDRAFWRERLVSAIAVRERLQFDATAVRLVHGEADLLPSLIVDRYADVLVVQTLSQGTEANRDLIVELLVELLQPRGVLLRNDPKVRTLEGLPQEVVLAYGEVPDVVEVREGPLTYRVDPWHGQKTGLFLDQSENHKAAASYARGRALDAFSYQGGFALRMAPLVQHVLALDASADAVAAITANAARHGLANVEAREANVFDALREFERADARFDTIVLDPPAFAKHKGAIPKAMSGYKDINLRALRLLNPGGHLITCTCSAHVDEGMFGGIILAAATDAQVPVVVVEKRMQARDHPVLLSVPETYYLKCFVLRRAA
ncbi:Ribosomal RNA large subunit methyltransferase I [Luteitalea pratensis]|uniref:Ribosomal RNA large subunit methyltransferase I n=1 Tax=Luteitalea pratensis TaxID=1855912 RepID=A0A143PXM0_LUTPR|nr:class I SAM-dependent rRNA methyltransferase [Luteitalea pratensis]AMY12584.1 Ribosomal RNA large subunit methyltransferase I [Luteitalea pratensis]